MHKKWTNVFVFFKSTLLINFSVCLVFILFGGLDSFFYIFASFGFMISALYKELYRKNDYLFYANNGISKIQLIGCTYLLTLFTAVVGLLFIFYINKLF